MHQITPRVPLDETLSNEKAVLIESNDNREPKEQVKELGERLHEFWRGDFEADVVKHISELLRDIEGAVCKKYNSIPPETQKKMKLGDIGESLEAAKELSGSWKWLVRFPALLITVAIASFCIPVANSLDEVIINHPILGGFPPAISAAAGCIGIQNTAIIIRALGVKLVTGSRLAVFGRYCFISLCLSLGAAVIEAFVAWIVVSVEASEGALNDPYSFNLLVTDVPIVIFFAMLATGMLAGCIGAGVPLLISKISQVLNRNMDPAHWVGPIETVAQELCAASLTFWIAKTFVFPNTPASDINKCKTT